MTKEPVDCLISFIWDGGNEDYVCHRRMTDPELEDVAELLALAEAQEIIRPGWYAGPIGMNRTPHQVFLEELTVSLGIDFSREDTP